MHEVTLAIKGYLYVIENKFFNLVNKPVKNSCSIKPDHGLTEITSK